MSENNQCTCRDSNRGTPIYKSEALLLGFSVRRSNLVQSVFRNNRAQRIDTVGVLTLIVLMWRTG